MALLLNYDFNAADCLNDWTIATIGSGVLEWQAAVGRDAAGGIFRDCGFASKSTGLASLAPGQSVFCGFWLKKLASPTGWQSYNMAMFNSLFGGYRMTDGVMLLRVGGGLASPNNPAFASANMVIGQWYYAVFEFKRASANGVTDGGVRIWKDGIEAADFRVYANYSNSSLASFYLGSTYYVNDVYCGDYVFDDIRIGETLADVEPARPPVDGELPQTNRTLVLFRRGDADSETFARSIVPDTNIVSLPCSSNETLSDYATFQGEVETPLKDFLAARPLLAAQATCIVAGLNVPGFFMDAGETFSTVGRLADIDNIFVASKSNPLAGASQRLTATILSIAGVRLAARIDASSLADVQTLKMLGDAAVTIAADEKYYTTGSTTLGEQLLRLEFKAVESGVGISGDAVVNYASGVEDLQMDAAGSNSRLTFIDSVSGHFRSTISTFILLGYRSLVDASEDFNITAFCNMLRLGGNIAEAFFVACEKLNYTDQLVSWPLLNAIFSKSGYNVYLGDGSPANVDYSQMIAAFPISSSEIDVEIPHKPDSVRAMCVRKVSSDGLEETRGRILMLEAESNGSIHLQLPVPCELSAHNTGDNEVELSFSCSIHQGQEQPECFEVLSDDGSGEINRVTPVATIAFATGEREYSVDIDAENRPAIFTVRARCEDYTGEEASPLTVLPLRVPVKPEVMI